MNILQNNKYKGYMADFLLLLVAIAWGTTFIIVQEAIQDTPVYVFLFWRFLLATIFMGFITYKHFTFLDMPTIKAGIVLGLFMFLSFAFQTFALLYAFSSTVAFITGINVVLVPFILYVLYKQKTSIYSLFGVFISVIGLYFLTASSISANIGYGEIYSFICSITVALHIVFTNIYSKKHNAFLLVFIQFGVVALCSGLGAIILDRQIMPKSFDGVFLQALIITVIFATIFAFLVQTLVQKYTTATKTAMIFILEPVSAGIFGIYIANENLLAIQLFGAGLIIIAMVIVELGPYFNKDKNDESKIL